MGICSFSKLKGEVCSAKIVNLVECSRDICRQVQAYGPCSNQGEIRDETDLILSRAGNINKKYVRWITMFYCKEHFFITQSPLYLQYYALMFVLLNEYTCFYQGFLMLTATKRSRSTFENITKVVWVFTGEAEPNTAKYHLKWLGTRVQWKGAVACYNINLFISQKWQENSSPLDLVCWWPHF